MSKMFSTIEDAIATLKAGKMIILVDSEDRENEGDFVIAAENVSAETINFMSRHGSGIVCMPITENRAKELNLDLMAKNNRSQFGTPFTVSIEAATGVTTGVSAADRARTIQAAIKIDAVPQDLISPGHVFPLQAREGGVFKRAGHTEASVDLMKIAGLTEAAAIAEVMNEDGTMSRRDELAEISRKHDIPLVTIESLIEYRIKNEQLITEQASARLPMVNRGDFSMHVFTNIMDDCEHFALVKPPKHANKVPLVRIHSECITGDVFGSCKCDCGKQLEQSLDMISEEGGVLIYLRQEGRGIGLANKIKAYALQQDEGLDTVEANVKLGLPVDSRNFAIAYQILKYMGIDVLRLITNNPAKIEEITKYGIKVSERIPVAVEVTNENRKYLETKRSKLKHLISI